MDWQNFVLCCTHNYFIIICITLAMLFIYVQLLFKVPLPQS